MRGEILPFLSTILFATRALNLGRIPDFSTITGASNVSIPFDGRFLKDFWAELGYFPAKGLPKSLNWKSFHMTTKSGPNSSLLKMNG